MREGAFSIASERELFEDFVGVSSACTCANTSAGSASRKPCWLAGGEGSRCCPLACCGWRPATR
jgi:hypothetical protein